MKKLLSLAVMLVFGLTTALAQAEIKFAIKGHATRRACRLPLVRKKRGLIMLEK